MYVYISLYLAQDPFTPSGGETQRQNAIQHSLDIQCGAKMLLIKCVLADFCDSATSIGFVVMFINDRWDQTT